MENTFSAVEWPHVATLSRLALALALGLFIGLERERRHKEAGVRTFSFTALSGCLGGLLGTPYALLSMTLLGILVIFLNWQTLRNDQGTELTTSAALLVTGFIGIVCGLGHTFTPVAIAIAVAALLTWKERLSSFSIGLTEVELRSAILLAILAFIIYPILPASAIDPWGLIKLQEAWILVILIATMGFINYMLLKLYGTRGIELAGFLGGLVNSTVTATELANRVRETRGHLADVAYRGVMLATAAMLIRNSILLGIVALTALLNSVLPFALMLIVAFALALLRGSGKDEVNDIPTPRLTSPFSLHSALKFSLIFLALQVGGTLAQEFLGQFGFYVVSIVGGIVSSASAVASAANLASHGLISNQVAGTGAVLASLTSAGINILLVERVAGQRKLAVRLRLALGFIIAIGIIGAVVEPRLLLAIPAIAAN